MYYNIITFIITIFIFSQDNNIIYWDERSTLEYSDFILSSDNDSWVTKAVSNVGIGYNVVSMEDDLKVSIRAFFNKKNSTIDGRKDSILIAHENLHFDIAEIHARKIRKIIDSLLCINHVKFEHVFQTYLDSMNYMNNIYDKETVKGMNVEAQNRWKNKIEIELSRLNCYSGIYVYVGNCKDPR